MARRRRSHASWGFGLLMIVLVVACAAAWLGAFDRLFYVAQVETGRIIDLNEAMQMAADEKERYVYAQLNDEDKRKYLILLDAFQSREPRTYPESDLDDLGRIRDCVLADHPEIFYVNGVSMRTTVNQASGLVTDVTVEGRFTHSPEEAEQLRLELDAAAHACIAGLPADADKYQKAKILYEFLAGHVEYDQDAAYGMVYDDAEPVGQTAVDALVGKKAVCAGYARAYQYLMRLVDIPCIYVSGHAKDGRHAWCAAFMDGNWYFIDPTWGDPQFLDENGASADYGRVNYDYLCVTDADIAATHVVDSPYAIPTCTGTQDNYFIREGLYLTEPDAGYAGLLIEQASYRGEASGRFRCASREVYDAIVYALFEEGEIYRFIPSYTCRYILGDDLLTVEVLFERES